MTRAATHKNRLTRIISGSQGSPWRSRPIHPSMPDMGQAFTRRLKLSWQVIRRPWWLVVLVLYSLVNLVGILRSELLSASQQDRWRILNVIPHWPWYWWTIGFLLVTAAFLLEGFYRVHTKALAERDAKMETACSQYDHRVVEILAELEDEKRKAEDLYPRISVDIKEVHLHPYHYSANCFVRFTIHNMAHKAPTLIQDYEILLTIRNEQHKGELASTAGYEIVKRRSVPGDDSSQGEPHWESSSERESLVDIRSEIESQLVAGEHKTGWLRFRFEHLPKWPEGEQLLRGVYEHYNEQSGEVEELYDYEPTYLTTTATSLLLTLKDSYSKDHLGQVSLPFSEPSRRIRKRNAVRGSLD